jgi:hypothetical protein
MTSPATTDRRRRAAARALEALGPRRGDEQRLSIQCPNGHHVGAVYETEVGPVFRALTGPHAHGSKDFVDTPHHGGSRGTEYVDLLEPASSTDDQLPAWCDCGSWTLSRAEVRREVRAGHRTWHVT